MSPLLFSGGAAPAQAFVFGGTGSGEIILIFVVLLLFFGPRKLPEIARMIGKVLSQLRSASNDFRDQVMKIEEEPDAPPVMDVESGEVEAAGQEDPEGGRRTDG